LPEVETIVRGLQTRVAGDRIQSVWIGSRKQPLKSSAPKIASNADGKRILRVHRMGKHIVLIWRDNNQWCDPGSAVDRAIWG